MHKAVQRVLGIVFLSAALFRIFNYPAAELEMSSLGLPALTAVLVIAIELTVAACFLTNRFVKVASLAAAIFLVVPISISLFLHSKTIYSELPALFVFNATATDVVLHVMFLILAVLIFAAERKNGRGFP